MINKKNLAAIALAWAAGAATASAQTLVWSDNFNDNNPIGWSLGSHGQRNETNQQFTVSGSFGPMPTNSTTDTGTVAWHSIGLPSSPLPDNQTLEARVDLVDANQNDAFAAMDFFWSADGRGYSFFKDQDELWMLKFTDFGGSLAVFFYETIPVKNQNVTLVFSLTRLGSNVAINTRVLDKDNGNAVLFDRTVTDTPQSDPVLPNRAVKGVRSVPDMLGTPWPVTQAPDSVALVMQWANPQSASVGAAQVTYDNLEVWQYQLPQLAIQNAVVLSWPVTNGQFVVESASSVDGPWDALTDPWWRTNNGQNQVSILAPESMKLFRLRR